MNGIASSVLQLCVAAYLSIMRRRAYAASKWYCAVDARHSSEMRVYPDVRAVAAFGAGAVSCEEAASRERSRSLPANILLILRPRSAGVKGFWISDTPGINMSAWINSPL